MTTDKIYTTLKQIRRQRPCGLARGSGEGYDKLRKTLGKGYGDDTPITFRQIYESNGYDDTLWCLRPIRAAGNASICPLPQLTLPASTPPPRGFRDGRIGVAIICGLLLEPRGAMSVLFAKGENR